MRKFQMNRLRTKTTLAFLVISIVITLFVHFILPNRLGKMFDQTIFSILEDSITNNPDKETTLNENRSAVQSVLMDSNGRFLIQGMNGMKNRLISDTLHEAFIDSVQSQSNDVGYYVTTIGTSRVFYIIIKNNTSDTYFISFLYDLFGTEMIKSTISTISQLLIVVLILGFIGLYVFVHLLTLPVIRMKKHVSKIANRNWNEELIIERKDEIGELAESIEIMRKNLVAQDSLQREMLQNISHDLKTPIMIIENYALAMKDGIYPEDTLDSSCDAIFEEAKRLETKVKSLIYLNKLEYLKTIPMTKESVDLKEVIERVVKSFPVSTIEFKLSLESSIYEGDFESWRIAIENIIENNIRYAKSYIEIHLNSNQLTIFNDGESIQLADPNDIFIPYKKGVQGQFGLGLSITKATTNLFDYDIHVENKDNGVMFKIEKMK